MASRTDPQALLFGDDPTPHVVAVEAGDDSARLFLRTPDGIVEENRPFRPWLLATQPHVLPGADWTELDGEGLRFLAEFPSRAAMLDARRDLRGAGHPVLGYGSTEKQFLARSGITLFKGRVFEDVHRLQLDLETEGLNPNAESNRILLIALRDNYGWETILHGDERTLLAGLIEAIHERDPDVIEGHNIFGFDLPYLVARARRLGIPLALGRDGSAPQVLPERSCVIGGMTRPFAPVHLYGRHVLDTMFAAQRFDWARGEWDSYGLKEVARALGVAEEERVLVDRAAMLKEIRENPERVAEYARHDVRETARIMQIVGATDFYVTQMVPDTYERAAVGGTGEKVDSLMIREYLRRGAAVPLSQPGRGIPGGYTECRRSGVIQPVVKVDVESLYPSLMLTRALAPSADRLGVFLPMLKELTARRLDAKARLKTAPPAEKPYWDGVQGSFKILINSFYGYLCAGNFAFNDYDAAEAVTRGGQEIVQRISAEVERRGGSVIEVDTDGVYFQPPPGADSEEERQALVEAVAAELPPGIRLAYEGSYAAMVSLKMKNYALVDEGGAVTYKGSALRSRSDERFGREFIAKALDRLVAGDTEGLSRLYTDTLRRIMSGEMDPKEFVRRERVTANTFGETLRDRWQDLLPHVRVGEYVLVYRKADGKLESIEHYAGDEDRAGLAEKLYKFAQRLKPALGDEFERVFPRPRGTKSNQQVALQTSFDW
ncbi:MAG: DNA polymerase [Armatimonadetes bacterium]|nr:DNA polymerase [Armatimonadota bacterium]